MLVWNSWNEEYSNRVSIKRKRYGNIKPKLIRCKSLHDRRFISTFCRLGISRLKMIQCPYCSCSDEMICDVNHVIFNCPRSSSAYVLNEIYLLD